MNSPMPNRLSSNKNYSAAADIRPKRTKKTKYAPSQTSSQVEDEFEAMDSQMCVKVIYIDEEEQIFEENFLNNFEPDEQDLGLPMCDSTQMNSSMNKNNNFLVKRSKVIV